METPANRGPPRDRIGVTMKRFLMVQLYRIQQAGTLLMPIMWAIAVAGIFWPIAAPIFVRIGLPESNVGLGILILLVLVLLGILALGYVYDKVLSLWIESRHVAEERNPYADRSLTRKEKAILEHSTIPIMERFAREDHRIAGHLEFMREWIKERP